MKNITTKVLWIFCLSATDDRLLEDTIWNIEAGMKFLLEEIGRGEQQSIGAILLVGDLHIKDKAKTVPQMMLEYISKKHPGMFKIFQDKFILEEGSLTSRENIPFGLERLEKNGIDPVKYSHIFCSEKSHLRLLSYLLKHWTKSTPRLIPSAQTKLGWKGRIIRFLQKIDFRLDPIGISPWYKWKHRQRQKYLVKQT